jgi:hypothetical protein
MEKREWFQKEEIESTIMWSLRWHFETDGR